MADDIGIQQEMLIEPTHKKLEIVDGHAVKDVEDYQNPELLYKSLSERVRKYHPSADVSMIEKAYHIARDAHKGQTRKSGEEYIIPVSYTHLDVYKRQGRLSKTWWHTEESRKSFMTSTSVLL